MSAKKPVRALPIEMPEFQTTSAKIRWLASQGWSVGDISRALGIGYQHAYNVIDSPMKQPREVVQ